MVVGQPLTRDEYVWPLSDSLVVAVALALGARDVPGWSEAEERAVRQLDLASVSPWLVGAVRKAVSDGADPLGDLFCFLRAPEVRRPMGATYTPAEIVSAMVEWVAGEGAPERVVDPGAGSARFAVAAGRRFRRAQLVAVELDPIAAILARGHLAAAGLSERARVVVGDYRDFRADALDGKTVYLGNPPYVRHHLLPTEAKEWLVSTARTHGLSASQLAGLHVYFFLATATHGAPGDFGAFITSGEWLDVNYGSLVRELLLDGLGGLAIDVLEPTVAAFEDAKTTAAITCFRLGAQPRSIRLRRVKTVHQLGKLAEGRPVRRERLLEARRWTPLTRATRKMPEGFVELGELCRVHRGAVTGSNRTWVVDPAYSMLPGSVLYASVTRARELFEARTVLDDVAHLRRVVDIPPDLDVFEGEERKAVDRFLRGAKRGGAASGYVARNRRAWWSVGLRAPAPILATYMARRPPVFVRNLGEARHINIAHGLYPRQEIEPVALDLLAEYLRASVSLAQGRTYAGGLTKFEPKEMERLPVPDLSMLNDGRTAASVD